MRFDVIIGNPPYQLKPIGDATLASPIYHLFIQQAISMMPRYITMVVPARWFAAGRSMDGFREDMLGSGNISNIFDFPLSKDVFHGVDISGGVCYFLWDKYHNGQAEVTTVIDRNVIKSNQMDLSEFDVFVRDVEGIKILNKVLSKSEKSITYILTNNNPFGIDSNFRGFNNHKSVGDIDVHYVDKLKRFVGYLPRSEIKNNTHLIDNWKVICPTASGTGKIISEMLGKPLVVAPGSACTKTFISFFLSDKEQAESLYSYYLTKFFRFLVSLRKITQNANRGVYLWVPMQTWDRVWTDEELYDKYGLTQEDQDYIGSRIKEMVIP